jgi:5-methyltetrahydropteroyltriglutamate--homocysteine methyltransferase
VGVISPIDPRVDTPEEVRDRVLEAAKYIRLEQLGTTDDCGFSPFSDDTSTTRETAFAKIRARNFGYCYHAAALCLQHGGAEGTRILRSTRRLACLKSRP